ncbi:hypothetical protein CPB85DRAFT_1255915 [Mucidula mucida]|nr:hypothetical protein CPB85DRAFT_1255915 [Mucidula mucida]
MFPRQYSAPILLSASLCTLCLSFSVLFFAYDSGFPFFLWAVKLARMYQRRCSWEALPQWSALWQSISRRIVNIGNEVAARLLSTKRRRDLSKWMYAAGLTCRLPSPIVFLVLRVAIWRWTRAWRIRRVLVEDDDARGRKGLVRGKDRKGDGGRGDTHHAAGALTAAYIDLALKLIHAYMGLVCTTVFSSSKLRIINWARPLLNPAYSFSSRPGRVRTWGGLLGAKDPGSSLGPTLIIPVSCSRLFGLPDQPLKLEQPECIFGGLPRTTRASHAKVEALP